MNSYEIPMFAGPIIIFLCFSLAFPMVFPWFSHEPQPPADLADLLRCIWDPPPDVATIHLAFFGANIIEGDRIHWYL